MESNNLEYLVQTYDLSKNIIRLYHITLESQRDISEIISPLQGNSVLFMKEFFTSVCAFLRDVPKTVNPPSLPSLEDLDVNASQNEIQEVWATYDRELGRYLRDLSYMNKLLRDLCGFCDSYRGGVLDGLVCKIIALCDRPLKEASILAEGIEHLQAKFPYRYGTRLPNEPDYLASVYPQPTAAWAYLFHVPGSTPPPEVQQRNESSFYHDLL